MTVGTDAGCKSGSNVVCQHLCIPLAKNSNTSGPTASCLCKAGYKNMKDGRCIRKILLSFSLNQYLTVNHTFLFAAAKQAQFLIYAQGKPSMIKGINANPPSSVASDAQVMVPVTDVGLVGAHDFHVATQSVYFTDRLK